MRWIMRSLALWGGKKAWESYQRRKAEKKRAGGSTYDRPADPGAPPT
jgi:hypothetical protein